MTGGIGGPSPSRQRSFHEVEKKSTTESAFQKENNSVIEALESQKVALDKADASGGKGGFHKTSVVVDGQPRKLFLKPKDTHEFSNFRFIQKHCAGREDSSILKYMPRVYGTHENYMVMEDLREAEGKQWTQIADLKMSRGGQSDAEELEKTGRPKGFFEKKVMEFQDDRASNFLFLEPSKLKRSINVLLGPEHLFVNTLRQAHQDKTISPKALESLRSQLQDLKNLLSESPMAFIGASVFIFISDDGKEAKVRLADPAHCIANPDQRENTPDTSSVFFSKDDDKYFNRLVDNQLAVNKMMLCANEAIESMVAESHMYTQVETKEQKKVPERKISIAKEYPKVSTVLTTTLHPQMPEG